VGRVESRRPFKDAVKNNKKLDSTAMHHSKNAVRMNSASSFVAVI